MSGNLPVPYGAEQGTLPPERVAAMFDRIARPYDAMNRVMTAGLEITTPESGAAARFHRLWFDRLVPGIGRLADRRGAGSAYSYLPASVRRFPNPTVLGQAMYAAGLDEVRYRPLGGGIVALHVGTVTAGRA